MRGKEVLVTDFNIVEYEWLRVSKGGTEGGYRYRLDYFRQNDYNSDAPYSLIAGSPMTKLIWSIVA